MQINGIIIEGADQQGKSTLCRFFASKLGWQIKHFSYPDEAFDHARGYLLPEQTISDRNFISEVAYRKAFNEKNRIDDVKFYCEEFNKRGFIVLILDRKESYVFENRPEKFTAEQIERVVFSMNSGD